MDKMMISIGSPKSISVSNDMQRNIGLWILTEKGKFW